VREVLVFAESALDADQSAWLLDRLEDLRQRPVICQVHLRPVRPAEGPAPVSARDGGRLPAQTARQEAPGESPDTDECEERDVELARARRRLHDLVDLVRNAGHVAHGELLAGPLIRALTRGIAERSPDQVILVTSDHRLELLLQRDLERRLRHAASVPVHVLTQPSGLPRR
jgi:hypothetical protein